MTPIKTVTVATIILELLHWLLSFLWLLHLFLILLFCCLLLCVLLLLRLLRRTKLGNERSKSACCCLIWFCLLCFFILHVIHRRASEMCWFTWGDASGIHTEIHVWRLAFCVTPFSSSFSDINNCYLHAQIVRLRTPTGPEFEYVLTRHISSKGSSGLLFHALENCKPILLLLLLLLLRLLFHEHLVRFHDVVIVRDQHSDRYSSYPTEEWHCVWLVWNFKCFILVGMGYICLLMADWDGFLLLVASVVPQKTSSRKKYAKLYPKFIAVVIEFFRNLRSVFPSKFQQDKKKQIK